MHRSKLLELDNRGLSIFEAMIVVFLVALFSLVLMSIFIVHARITIIGLRTSEMHAERAQIQRELKNNTRIAASIVSSRTINSESYITDDQTCIIRIPSIDSADDIITDTYDYGVFYFDDAEITKMMYSQESDPLSSRHDLDKLLSDSVSNLQFIYDGETIGDSEILISNIQLQESFLHKVEEVSLNLQLKLGNK